MRGLSLLLVRSPTSLCASRAGWIILWTHLWILLLLFEKSPSTDGSPSKKNGSWTLADVRCQKHGDAAMTDRRSHPEALSAVVEKVLDPPL